MELTEIKGIGQARLKKLNNAGFYKAEELINHTPYKYADLTRKPDFEHTEPGEELAFSGILISSPALRRIRRGLTLIKAEFDADGKKVSCAFFNQNFLIKALKAGVCYTINGKLKRAGTTVEITAPVILKPREGETVVPLYRPIPGLPQSVFREALIQIFKSVRIENFIPVGVLPEIPDMHAAFLSLHFPKSLAEAYEAAKALSLTDLAVTIARFSLLKVENGNKRNNFYKDKREELLAFVETLPYSLTAGQRNALSEIVDSLHSDKPMNRLLEGDVGCGKTAVSLLSMYYAYLSGFQSAMMAPTEILARQHYSSAIEFFKNIPVKITFVSASLSKAERDAALFNIKYGAADIVIGTHSLISEQVEFARLSLTVADEQHRFGVSQRGALENKAAGADRLVMSATPIPRTLALTYYGDLDISVIKERPVGRPQIITRLVKQDKLNDMIKYLGNRAEYGEQSYLVCPRVEEQDDGLVSAEGLFSKLKKGKYASIVGLLHGKQSAEEKHAAISEFKNGRIKLLVTTTVIEVGIDVKSAVNIVIFNPERYGLSQLHQLRGRVGRGQTESYCFLAAPAEQAMGRLRFFASHSDGFELSEYDFEQRGAGDFIGERQHGGAAVTKEILEQAKTLADKFMKNSEIKHKLLSDLNQSTELRIKNLALN